MQFTKIAWPRGRAPRLRERVRHFRAGARARSEGARRAHGDRRARFRHARPHQEGAVDAIYDNHTHYTPSSGILSLRATIAEYASRFRRVTPEWRTGERRHRSRRKADHLEHADRAARSGRRVRLLRSGVSGVRVVRELPQAKVHAIPLLESRNWRMDLRRAGAPRLGEDQSRRHQLAAQSDRRRAHARRSRAYRRAGAALRLPRLSRRDLQPQLLSRRRVFFDRVAAGHARSHDRRRRILESVRDDGLASGLRDCTPSSWRAR